MNEIKFTWEEFGNAVEDIIRQLKEKNLLDQFKYIYGVPRGGLILAIVLSHRLNKKLALKPIGSGGILVVDDISETGNTLHWINPKLSATIHMVPGTSFVPTIHSLIKKPSDWIVFPWENPDDPHRGKE
jgi:hypoxanthine phosphoribosyltransferase